MNLLEHLRAAEVTTVANIADHFAVSRRTVMRDLATLRDLGWPIQAESGPGGGVYLDRHRGVTAVHLAIDEVAALWLATRLSATMSNLPWSTAARSALDKVFAAMPQDRARTLRRMVERVVVGRPATERIRAALGAATPELLTTLERSFADNLCLGFVYTDRRGRRTRRVIEPHGLLVEPPAWYVLARDTATGDARMFRMDRIRRPRVVSERAFTPDFDGLHRQAKRQRAAEAAG